MAPDDRLSAPAAPGNGAVAIVEALRVQGVEVIFGLPGTTLMNVIDALHDEKRIRYVPVRHEQVAAYMADGYARGSGKLGVCMGSRAPGAANLTIGVHNAHSEAVPLLALIGQISDSATYREAFEELDMVTFFGPLTKWALEIHQTERIPELVQRACRTAESGRPGAVMVSIPHDIQTAELSSPSYAAVWKPHHSQASDIDISAAAELLRTAEAPAIIVGGGVTDPEPIRALAERLAAPVVTTWLRNSNYPNSTLCYLGGLGYGSVDATNRSVSDADVVVAFGSKMSEFSTQKWTLLNCDSELIHVDVDEEALGRVYVPSVGIVADAHDTAQRIDHALSDLDAVNEEQRRDRLAALRSEYARQTVTPTQKRVEGVTTSRAVLDALVPIVAEPATVIVGDAPGFSSWIHRHLPFDRPGSFYGGAGGSMGWGFAAGMGLKVARPDADVVVITGDGGFWMVAQDLETAVRENIAITVIVMNNFSFGNTRDRQRFAFGERYEGVFYGNPDFAAFAEMLGAHGERVTNDDEVAPALKRAMASGLPAVVDIVQDQHEGLLPDLVPIGITESEKGESN